MTSFFSNNTAAAAAFGLDTSSLAVVETVAYPPGIPTISGWPNSSALTVGETMNLTCVAEPTGGVPTSFTWFLDGGNLTTTTGSLGEIYTVLSVNVSDAGDYKCMAINHVGFGETLAKTLTVRYPPGTPTITGWPAGSELNVDDTLTLTCNSASYGGVALSYEWYLGGSAIPSAGSEGETYVQIVSLSDVGEYKCAALNDGGQSASTPLNLTVNDPPRTPITSGWPFSSSLTVGAALSLTCSAQSNGGTPTSFEWYLDSTLLNSTGSLGETYQTTVSVSDAGAYKCKAINAGGQAESSILNLQVLNPPHTPTITGWPSGSNVLRGDTFSLICNSASTGGVPTSFSWFLGTTNLPSDGAQGENYTKVAALTDIGVYCCKAINGDGEAASAATQNLTVTPHPPNTPTISGWPSGSSLEEGQALSLTCVAASSGGAVTSYEWYLGSTKLNSMQTYNILVMFADAGVYKCRAINEDGYADSATSTLAVTELYEPTFGITFSLNQNFTSDLQNSSSAAYIQLESDMIGILSSSLSSSAIADKIKEILITGFSSGSIVVDSQVVLFANSTVNGTSSVSSSSISNIMVTYLTNNSDVAASFNLDVVSISVEEITTAAATTTTTTTKSPALPVPGKCNSGVGGFTAQITCNAEGSACVSYKKNGLNNGFECGSNGFCDMTSEDKRCCCTTCNSNLCNNDVVCNHECNKSGAASLVASFTMLAMMLTIIFKIL
ncbi:basement membrane-specific heparan sulfate proteoglycan core protein-like [Lineus longissimus]|uniref:basement membrane-specific heparan sulfate proteoglycan core protein-like n=1 Tax=Lineus longissimus TaxID=88925 RepID=UPI00315CAC46